MDVAALVVEIEQFDQECLIQLDRRVAEHRDHHGSRLTELAAHDRRKRGGKEIFQGRRGLWNEVQIENQRDINLLVERDLEDERGGAVIALAKGHIGDGQVGRIIVAGSCRCPSA